MLHWAQWVSWGRGCVTLLSSHRPAAAGGGGCCKWQGWGWWPVMASARSSVRDQDRGCAGQCANVGSGATVATELSSREDGISQHTLQLWLNPDTHSHQHVFYINHSDENLFKQWLSKRNSCHFSKTCVWTSLLDLKPSWRYNWETCEISLQRM